jgi:hypothetical protein
VLFMTSDITTASVDTLDAALATAAERAEYSEPADAPILAWSCSGDKMHW